MLCLYFVTSREHQNRSKRIACTERHGAAAKRGRRPGRPPPPGPSAREAGEASPYFRLICTPSAARVSLAPVCVEVSEITTPFWFFMRLAAAPPPIAAPAWPAT